MSLNEGKCQLKREKKKKPNLLYILPFCLSRFLWNWIFSSISNIFTVPSSQPTWNRQHSCNQTQKHTPKIFQKWRHLCEKSHYSLLTVFLGCCNWWSRLVPHRRPRYTWASAFPNHTQWSLHSSQRWTDAHPPNIEPQQPCRLVLGSPVQQRLCKFSGNSCTPHQ